MAKKKRVEIPLLQINPEQEKNVRDVMARMRGNYTNSLPESGRPQSKSVDAHNFQPLQIVQSLA